MMDGPLLNEDDRYQVELTARATERRNSSALLVVLALLVLGVCSIVWLWSWRDKSVAISQLRHKHREQVTLQAKLTEISRLQQSPEMGAGEPINDMWVRIKRVADQARVSDLPPPKERSDSISGGVVRTYEFKDVSEPTPDPIIEWIRLALDTIDGLEISTLQVDPNDRLKKWDVTVHFRRWERAQ
jgi:hypothetical protein